MAVSIALGVTLGVFASWTPTVDAGRNGAGTYSLPAGNPVVSGTTISSTWANSTLSDIATELTNSLDRNGTGGMSGALKLANGTSAAPALSWTSETNSGLYRNASNDIRMGVGATNVQRWSTTTATFPLAVAVTGAQTNAGGITVTQSSSNTAAITATGNGTAAGITSTGGGTSGDGVSGTGGVTNGNGIRGVGGETTGEGGYFTGASNGYGVHAVGGSSGVAGIIASNGIAATGGTRRNAVVLTNGDLSLDGVADATHTTSIKNALTPSNIVKVWGDITGNGATPTANAAFNVASLSCAASVITVTIAQDFATANYGVVVNGPANYACWPGAKAAGSFTITCYDLAGTPWDLCATTPNINFIAMGQQ